MAFDVSQESTDSATVAETFSISKRIGYSFRLLLTKGRVRLAIEGPLSTAVISNPREII